MKKTLYYFQQHPYLSSFFCGALLAFSLPPFSLPFLLFPAFIGFYDCLIKTTTKWQAFKIGYCFGFSYFLIMLYWPSYAIFTNLQDFWWVLPFSFFGIPATLALYISLFSLIFYIIKAPPMSRIFIFAFLWSIFEYIRGTAFTGFPWNLIGYAWIEQAAIMQSVSLFGIYGLGLVTILATLTPLLLFQETQRKFKYILICLLFTSFISLMVWGQFRLMDHSITYPNQPKTIRLVQANIPQKDKWNSNYFPHFIEVYKNLSAENLTDSIEMIIWGETAVPYFLDKNPELRAYLSKILKPDQLIATGGMRLNEDHSKVWNSIHFINHEGQTITHYDKFHLLPFGEYIPFRNFIPLQSIAGGSIDFSEGPGPQTLSLLKMPSFSPLICYESIFPAKVLNRKNKPNWLMVISNDGWFGKSAGPYQHFAISSVRTIEEGIPMIRLSNSGISGVIDALGRIVDKTSLGEKTVLDVAIPKQQFETIYSQYGNKIFFLMLSILFFFIIIIYTSEKKNWRAHHVTR